jgi:glycosyltransferase involved in cell wall biosynthesis
MGKAIEMSNIKKAVVIPCYKVSAKLPALLEAIPNDIVDYIIIVDDACPEQSGQLAERLKNKDCVVLYHSKNQGVGGAVITGYLKALELGCEIIIKMDGDGQMSPAYLDNLIQPLLAGAADYTKGNRFNDSRSLITMPAIRLFGNSLLSFIVKVVSGYWNIMDPTNGYTAIHKRVLDKININRISRGYFFEIGTLLELNLVNAVVKDMPIPARYDGEQSSLKISRILIKFPFLLLKGFVRRIFLKYFIYDFNMGSVYLLIGLPMFTTSFLFGVQQWVDSYLSGMPKPAGTIMLAALPIIISFQMLLQAINIDISNTPKR